MKKAIFAFFLIVIVCYLAYEALIQWQEERLEIRARGIQKGMRTEEVIEIMGKPKFEGCIDSKMVPVGWDSEWKKSYEETMKKYEKLLFFNYHTKRFEFISNPMKVGYRHINIHFDPVEKKVVYVSIFF